jgi:ammonium transporter, Amt family
LQIFASHGIGGLVGNILTGIFAQASIAGLDGYTHASGWINKHFIQLGYQLADSTAGIVYAFVMTVSSRFLHQ